MKKIQRLGNKGFVILLVVVMGFSFLPLQVKADVTPTPTAKTMMLWNEDTKQLLNPPAYEGDKDWVGNKVYWGDTSKVEEASKKEPMKWDILNTKETGFDENKKEAMLLFYTGDLGKTQFNPEVYDNYDDSALNNHIKTRMKLSLSSQEENATLVSSKDEVHQVGSLTFNYQDKFSGKKWFAPTAKMISTSNYGFLASDSNTKSRDYDDYYWLSGTSVGTTLVAGSVGTPGNLYFYNVKYPISVRVATNLRSESILFVSNAEGIKGSTSVAISDNKNGEYKLTLKDGNQSTPIITNIERNGNTVSFDYDNVTIGENQKLSMIITDKDGKQIIQYGVIEDVKKIGSGSSSITLPKEFDQNEYQLQFFSEQCNGDFKTDYASELMKAPAIPVAKYSVKVTSGSADVNESEVAKTVTIVANSAPTGQHFKEWQVIKGEVTLADAKQATTTFTMPNTDVEVSAVYEDNDNVKVMKAKKLTQKALDSVIVGNNTTKEDIEQQIKKAISSIPGVSVSLKGELTLQKATWLKTGSFKGMMSLKCGNEIEEVEVNKTIQRIKPIVYSVKESGTYIWNKNSEEGLIITIDATISKFQDVRIDEQQLDKAMYSTKSGSTIINIKNEYLKTLSVGNHEMLVLFDDGYSVVSFTLQDKNVETADTTQTGMWMVMGMISLSCMIVIMNRKLKRK